MAEEKKKRHNLYDFITGGKNNRADVDLRSQIKGFNTKNMFRLYFRRFRQITILNIMMIMTNFPLIFLGLAISGLVSNHTVAPVNPIYSGVYGITTISGPTPATAALNGLFMENSIMYYPSVWTYVCYGLSFLEVITIGLGNVGIMYVMRNLVRGEPLFLPSDFFDSIKTNFKLGLITGVIDSVLLVLCGFSIYSYWVNYGNYYILFFASVLMLILYLILRNLLYLMIVTFDQKYRYLVKNALIFTILGFGRNFLALLGGALICALFYSLSVTVFIPIGVIAFVLFIPATIMYFMTYVGYWRINDIMIEPYYQKHPNERPKVEPVDDYVGETDDPGEEPLE